MKANEKLTFSALFLHVALVEAANVDVDQNQLLVECGIDPKCLANSEARIPIYKMAKLYRTTASLIDDEIFGLLNQPFRLGQFKYMALSVINAPTIGVALCRLIEYNNLFRNSFIYTLDVQSKNIELTLSAIPGQPVVGSLAVDAIFNAIHRFLGWLSNERLIPQKLRFKFSQTCYHKEYRYIYYGSPVIFNQVENQIVFDREILDFPVVQNESSLRSYLARAPLDIYLPLDIHGSTSAEVRKQLQIGFSKNNTAINLEEAANGLSLSVSQLRKKLEQENTNYRTIKLQVRRDIAIHFLELGRFSVEDVAEKTGYSEAAAFIRAFKEWTGYTPYQFSKKSF